jgi:threonylcarbamoyladenosine tRNA methylthiotransferase MtaB
MKISFYTLGCKLNQAESDELKEKLLAKQYEIVDFASDEDISIIRACAVTHGASQRTRQIIRQIKRKKSYVIATGCLENKELVEIDFIAKDNQEILKHLENNFKTETKTTTKSADKDYVRKFIKIQNGCNFNCSYCVIPSYRGKNTSIEAEKIIKKIKDLEKKSYQEIVLTGVNICQYKYKNLNLTKLLKKILKETKIKRVRLGSLDPRLIDDDFINIFKNKKMMPHIHLSLQSGSDEILKKMNRHYRAKKYLNIINKFKKINKYFSFTTDIIVGFPSETEKDFLDSCKIIEKVCFSKVHLFPFSPRPKTPAEKMTEQIKDNIKKERMQKITKVANLAQEKYLKKMKNKSREILIEGKRRDYFEGYSPEFIRIKIKSDKDLKNQIIKLKI